jgi:hypothetical protein
MNAAKPHHFRIVEFGSGLALVIWALVRLVSPEHMSQGFYVSEEYTFAQAWNSTVEQAYYTSAHNAFATP